MNSKISVRQICFVMLIYTAVTKFLLYPNILAYTSGRDLLFPAAITFLIQGIIVWSVSYLCSRTDKTFFGLLASTFGDVGARIVYGFFAAFFLLSAIIPLFEQKLYAHAIFYDTVPSLVIFLPFIFFSVYAASKSFRNIGRCADICLPVFVISMLFIFAMAFPEVKWDDFLPVLKTPAKNVLMPSLTNFFRFPEPCWLLMFMAKITLSYAGAAAFVLVMLLAFYGVYGDVACSRVFAISKISLFFSAIDVVGRIDLIALYFLEFTMLFALVLNMQLAVHCIGECSGYKNGAVLSVAVNLFFIILLFVFDNGFDSLLKFFSQWMWLPAIIFATVIPLLCWTLKKGDKNA